MYHYALTTTLLLMVISHKFTNNLSVGLDVGARWGPCACSGGREAERLEATLTLYTRVLYGVLYSTCVFHIIHAYNTLQGVYNRVYNTRVYRAGSRAH